jgi:hypothetical protein
MGEAAQSGAFVAGAPDQGANPSGMVLFRGVVVE